MKKEPVKSADQYIPGNCNLGRQEISIRRRNTVTGFMFSLATLLFFEMTHVSKDWKLLLFFPLYYFFISLIQTRNRFCVYYGMRGKFNFEKFGRSTSVENEEFIKLDRKKAILMAMKALVYSLAVTIVYYLLSN